MMELWAVRLGASRVALQPLHLALPPGAARPACRAWCTADHPRCRYEPTASRALPPQLPNKKAKVAAWIIGVTTLGVGIPCFAVVYQQNKLKGA